MEQLGVVVVAWNSEAEIGGCLEALGRVHVGPVVVVDNASKDGTRAVVRGFAGVKLVESEKNLGFSGGVNRGVAELETEFVLILNPDLEVRSGLGAMCEAARGGAAGGKMLGEDGQVQRGFQARRLPRWESLAFEVLGLNRIFPENSVNQRWRCLDFDPEVQQVVEQPPGAFFLVRRDVFAQLGGMDEDFWPVWFEDVDFCQRLWQAGYRIEYCPEAVALHAGGRSIKQIYWANKELAWYGSLLRYATKHYGWLARRLVGLAVAAASVPRAITGILFRHQSFTELGVYAVVMRMACGTFTNGRVDIRRLGQMDDRDHLRDA